MAGHQMECRFDGTPHGGYYSKSDLREIVAYAARRCVTVVPEIDMPGHMQAAIAAYPWLGNTPERLEVFTSWGISDHVLNLEEPTLQFCTEVLEEVIDMFPSPAVHVGGDECPTLEWEKSAHAQQLMRELGMNDERALQSWFTARMSRFLAEHGRLLMGWDEILEAGAPPGALVMAWRRPRWGALAAETGHDVVMAPMQFLYFDWASTTDQREPVAIGAPISTEQVYNYEPIPRGLAPEHHSRIRGAQCQLWTEYVADGRHAEYMYFPRACAFAEVVWSSPGRDWSEFRRRLEVHTNRLDALGVNFRPLEGPRPGQMRTWLAPAQSAGGSRPGTAPRADT
jgi:hexosaminidase